MKRSLQAREKKRWNILSDLTNYTAEEKEMLSKVKALKEDYKQGKMDLPHEVSAFLSNWLNKHIAGTDKQYSSFMNSVGVN
jgi:hemerythrin